MLFRSNNKNNNNNLLIETNKLLKKKFLKEFNYIKKLNLFQFKNILNENILYLYILLF